MPGRRRRRLPLTRPSRTRASARPSSAGAPKSSAGSGSAASASAVDPGPTDSCGCSAVPGARLLGPPAGGDGQAEHGAERREERGGGGSEGGEAGPRRGGTAGWGRAGGVERGGREGHAAMAGPHPGPSPQAPLLARYRDGPRRPGTGGGHACDSGRAGASWQNPPSPFRAALRAIHQRGSTLTRSRLCRPEETAGHTFANQRVEALGLQALRGGRPVSAPQAPRPSPHAAKAHACLPTPLGLSLASAALWGGNRAGPPPTPPQPALLPAGVRPGGTTLSQGPGTPDLLSVVSPFNHHPQTTTGRAFCWALR